MIENFQSIARAHCGCLLCNALDSLIKELFKVALYIDTLRTQMLSTSWCAESSLWCVFLCREAVFTVARRPSRDSLWLWTKLRGTRPESINALLTMASAHQSPLTFRSTSYVSTTWILLPFGCLEKSSWEISPFISNSCYCNFVNAD